MGVAELGMRRKNLAYNWERNCNLEHGQQLQKYVFWIADEQGREGGADEADLKMG